LALGPDASNAIGNISDLIQNDQLFSRLHSAADLDPNRDARPIITAWMSEQPGKEYDSILDQIQGQSDEAPVDDVDVDVDVKTDKTDNVQTKSPPPSLEESTQDLVRLKRLLGL
jgi:hypothetical protein